jgi:hypothetical protein
MWINQDVDLPQELVTAQRDGHLVIFAGAGVSMGPPSNLPAFDALATDIAERVTARKDGESLDAFLGRVEQHGVNVQTRARALIDLPTSTPRALHHLIVNLFKAEDAVRLVTTNFDRHFTAAVRAKYANAEVFTAPALPLGRECSGLIYLHGAVEKPRSHLVLTDGDFGRAYLADGWATRFLMEMFREFSVLFVGYSHQDPVMRYLARSFVGGTSRFALTEPRLDDHWRNLAITPVHFPLRPEPNRYSAIDDALESWSKKARMGAFDHQVQISQVVDAPPPLDPETADYLRLVLASRVTLSFFTAAATRVEWFTWVENEGFFAPLVAITPLSADEPRLLAQWFTEHFVVQHPKETLEFVRRHAATMNSYLCDAIALHLTYRVDEVPAATLRLWAMALLAVKSTPSESLTNLLVKCADAGDVDTTAVLFCSLLRPQLRFERHGAPDFGGPLALGAGIGLRGDEHDLRRAWETAIRPNVAMLYRELLPMITAYLNDAHGLLSAAGRGDVTWDPMSFRRVAVEQHEQNPRSEGWGLLVDVARDVLDWTVANDPSLARATIGAWSAARPQLLIRLAIYGTGRGTDLTPNEALASIERHGWLYASSLKHETFGLLAGVFAAADEEAQRRFVTYSMTPNALGDEGGDPDTRRSRDYARYNVSVWLRRIAPESPVARAHFEELQQEHQDFGPREHPDMDRWISGGFVGPQSPKTTEQLLAMPVQDAVAYLTEYQPEVQAFGGPDREGLMTIFEQAASGAVTWSLSVADELIARQMWNGDMWASLLAAWRSATLDDESWARVLGLLDSHPQIGNGSASPTVSFLEHTSDRKDIADPQLERLERVGERLLPASDTQPAGVHRGDGSTDWLTSAINHPAGQVALTWTKALARRMALAEDQWPGIPEAVRGRFEGLLTGGGANGELARVAFASQLHFLFRADRPWTEVNIIPLFDWDSDAIRAAQAWDGFVCWGRWNDALFDQMQPYVLQTFQRMADLGNQQEGFVAALAGVAAFSARDPWRGGGWLFEFMRSVDAEHRAQWATDFGRYIESLSAEGTQALWDRWLSDYWSTRITGVPRPLEDVEKQAMVTWVCALRSQLASAVGRVIDAPPETLDRYVFHHLGQSGIAESHSGETGRLLKGLMAHLNSVSYDTGEVLELATQALVHGADPNDLVAVADEMIRLGITGAEQLRNLATTGSH